MIEKRKDYDKIHIRDLLVSCIIGINKEERVKKQDIIINIILYFDLKKACQSDRIEDSVDYEVIIKNVISLVKGSSFFLIEKLAEEIAQICLKNTKVIWVEVTVDKPKALQSSRFVGVEITRYQKTANCAIQIN